MAQPLILSIPPELRDVIYEKIFDICNSADSTPPLYQPEDVDENRDIRLPLVSANPSSSCVRSIDYLKAYPRYPLLPMLQINRQIRAEFKSFLNRRLKSTKPGRGMRYELDIAASYQKGDSNPVHQARIRPTWKVLPLPPEPPYNIIEELKINYRLVDYDVGINAETFSRPFRASKVLTTRVLCRLVRDFFCHGPQGLYDSRINAPPPRPSVEYGDIEISTSHPSRCSYRRCWPLVRQLTFNLKFDCSTRFKTELETILSWPDTSPGAVLLKENSLGNYRDRAIFTFKQKVAPRAIKTVECGTIAGQVGRIIATVDGDEIPGFRDALPRAMVGSCCEWEITKLEYGYDGRKYWEPREISRGKYLVWGHRPLASKRHTCCCERVTGPHLHH
ncbi:hypothetical protein TWF696_004868 [Orbilia brochopaga]|uniref:Uncharacterized protein n=1 Tax=Orbilia brochopaga TaxID=3140254 RepID=A0AAV9V0L1_9PEZI